jgi:DNA-binding winged helix-turn-helix (wHTH) protein/tetratricopeptide (TPR) repeat protein
MSLTTSPNFLYAFGTYRLNVGEAQLLCGGRPIPLPPKTFEVLTLLVRRAGSLVDRDTLMRELWPDTFVEEANIARHIWTLRQAFGAEEYIETVPKRGYRFTAPVRAMTMPAAPAAPVPSTRIMVLPFRLGGTDGDLDLLAFSLPEAIASSLGGIDTAIVRSTLVAARFAAEPLDLERIAREADVNRVVAGSILRSGDRVRVTAQLLEAPGATVLATASADAEMGDLFQLQDQLVTQIVAAVVPPLGSRERRAVKGDVPAHNQAYGWYLRANRLSHRPADYQQALQLYLACVEADAGFAPAWARLGRLYRVMGKYGGDPAARLRQAEAALARAVALNPELSFAQTQYAAMEVDLGRAVDAMVRLLMLARERRNDPEIFAGLVTACRYSGLLDAAIAAHRHAVELDPLIPTSVVQAYWMRGDVALALAESAKLAGGSLRAMVLALAGREDEAIADLRDQEGRMPHPVMRQFTMALRTVLEGDRAAALAAIEPLLAMPARDPEGYYFLARYLARIGERDRANGALVSALAGGFNIGRAMAWDPWLEALRDTPGFAAVKADADAGYRAAVAAFQGAGGESVLGQTY